VYRNGVSDVDLAPSKYTALQRVKNPQKGQEGLRQHKGCKNGRKRAAKKNRKREGNDEKPARSKYLEGRARNASFLDER